MTAPALKDKADKPDPDKTGLKKLPKAKLIAMILEQREDTRIRLEEKERQITELREQLAKLQGETNKKKAEQKIKDLNQQVNQPSSKKPERDKDGYPTPTTKSEKKKKNPKKRRNKRTGCGNRGKSDLTPDETNFIPLASCPDCGNDLSGREGKADSGRIVEDNPPPAQKTTVFKFFGPGGPHSRDQNLSLRVSAL